MSQAEQLKEQGIKLYKDYDYEQALKVFEQARVAYEQENKPDLAAEMLVNIGLVHRALNQGQQALEVMQQALQVFQDIGDASRTAQVLGNLGGVYVKLGDKEQAYNAYRQAADIFDELGDKQRYSETLLAMGELQVREGKFMAGAATYGVGLENVDNPSVTQRMIKGLVGFSNRLLGGSPAPSTNDPEDKK